MKYLGAYLLASLGGNASPSAQDLLKILGAGELDCDMAEATKVVEALAGKTVSELISEGKSKMSSVPSGGAGGAAAPAASSAAAPAAAAAKKEEPQEDSDSDMGLGLFD